MLWHGTIGHISELSSAKEQRSEGAWAQAWSVAIYMEAMEEIVKFQEFFKPGFEGAIEIKVFKPAAVKAKKSDAMPYFVTTGNVRHETNHHKNLLKMYEIILIITLIFSVSVALGAAAFAATR